MEPITTTTTDSPQALLPLEWMALLPIAYLVLKHVVNPVLRRMAWNVSVVSSPHIQRHPGHHAEGWSLWGEAPGFDARGWYMFATHTPIYLFKMLYATARFPLLLAQHYMDHNLVNKIPDSAVFAYCSTSTLVILTKFAGDTFVFEMDPKTCPVDFETIGNCDLATLRIVFDLHGRVLSASSKNGPVASNNPTVIGCNEILVMALLNINSSWTHPLVHVYSEKNALEIQSKRIDALEPSVHFVSSLHEGLLHGPLSPKGPYSPFNGNVGTSAQFMNNCFSHPMPPHVLDERKMRFETYEFLMAGRTEIFRLVRAHNLRVEPEALFMHLIMHELDHETVYENLSALPLCSADGTGSLFSYWRTHCYTFMWLRYWENPMASNRITAHLDKPFYRELYHSMSKINQKRADEMLVSCCF